MDKAKIAHKTPVKNSFADRLTRHLTIDRVIIGGSLLATLVIIGVIALNSIGKQPPRIDFSLPDKSVAVPIQGADHIEVGEAHEAYNSNPPTSGWMYNQSAGWGAYREVLPDEAIVHNLEHGGIWISYQNAQDEGTIRQLEEIVRRYGAQMILTPRPANESPIAVAAWGKLLTLDTVDEAQISNFIARYRFKGPEMAG